MKKIALIVGCLCGFLVSCEFQNIDWQPGTDSIAPGTVSNVSVENLPGGAKITYDLPDEKDLAFVEANYTIDGKSATYLGDVDSFDENTVLLRTNRGPVCVRGEGLQLRSLSVEGGQAAVDGTVAAIVYEGPARPGGFLRRLLG